MTAELVRGQNHPLPQARLEIRVSAGTPVVAGATLGDEQGTVHGIEWIAHPGAPHCPGSRCPSRPPPTTGSPWTSTPCPPTVHRVTVLLALPTRGRRPGPFGAVAAPFVAVTGLDGTEIASFTITGLDAESAVVALELYRRQGAWKVRAVGQGYAGGLAACSPTRACPRRRSSRGSIHEAVARGLARSVAPPPPRTPDGRPASATAAPDRPTRPPARRARRPAPRRAPPAPRHGPRRRTPPGRPHRRRRSPAVRATAARSTTRTRAARPPRRPPPPPTAPPAEPGQPAQPVAGDATGWSMEERLYNQVWGMFEDLARTIAAYRSAVDFAESRMDQELDQALSDPRSRIGGRPATPPARQARAKHADLVDQARAALDRDLAQLAAESEVVEPALPAAFAALGQPGLARLPRCPMEMPMAAAARRPPSAREPRPAHPACSYGCRWSAACGSTAGARHSKPRSPIRTSCAASPWTRGRARRPAARRLPGGRVRRPCHRPGRLGGAALAPLVRLRRARRAARRRRRRAWRRCWPGSPERVDLVQMAMRGRRRRLAAARTSTPPSSC